MRPAPLAFALAFTLGASCRCTRSVSRQISSAVRGDPTAIGGCAVLPPDDPWNTDVSDAPLHPRSDAIIANIAAHGPSRLHADFGSLARYGEVGRGAIRHALRVTFDHTQAGWIAPANHPGGTGDTDAPPMGMRLRLKRSFDVSRFQGQTRVILEALRRYGLMTADTGTNWYISGAPDPRWDPDDLDALAEVPGSAFEVVDTGAVEHR